MNTYREYDAMQSDANSSIIGPSRAGQPDCDDPKWSFSDKQIDRFWGKVDIMGPQECWTWLSSKSGGRYGAFTANNRHYQSHRVSYSIKNGAIPEGKVICHTCDNPLCVNPEHLFMGTQLDNVTDMMNKNRQRLTFGGEGGRLKQVQNTARGSENHLSKLNEESVLSIRREYVRRVVTHKMLASKYGVTTENIKMILKRKTWKHV